MVCAFVVCGLIAVGVGVALTLGRHPRWNVVIVTLDTTRADHMGCYGHPHALTPALDGLAAGGVLFEHAYAAAPLTLPSHASIFTGLYPPEHGLRTNGRSRLTTEIPTLAEVLQTQGYETGAFIAAFVLDSKFGLNRGFQTYGDDLTGAAPADHALHRSRDGNVVMDEALAWLEGHRRHPFFCWVHLYDPHVPYLPHGEIFGDRFRDQPYDAEIAFIDRQVARLLDFLEGRKLKERTIVLVVGDHGEGLGEHLERKHGQMLYNSTMHVPLIAALPGTFSAGKHVETPVSLVDLFPTILDCLHLQGQTPVSGRSLKAGLEGQVLEPHICYGETEEPLLEAGWSPLQSLTTDTWKYIRSTRVELYDLMNDRAERQNLAETRIEQIAALEQQLHDIERKMVKRVGTAVPLSHDERRALTSLGYLGNPTPANVTDASERLPDIKDMLVHYNALEDARHLLDAGDVERAVESLQCLTAAAPDFDLATIVLGDALLKQRQPEAAVENYKKVLKRNPDCVEAHSHLGNARAEQGRYADAIPHYLEALERDPDAEGLQYHLGRALARLGRLNEALPHFEAALKLDPGYVFAHVETGALLTRQGRLAEAIAHYRTALKYNSNSVHARMNLAMVLAGTGELSEALVHLERAAQLSPHDAEVQFQLGTILAVQGKLGQAVAPLSEAVRLKPDFTEARERLRQVQEGLKAGK